MDSTQLKQRILDLYGEYREFEKIVKQKNEEIFKNKSSLRESLEGKSEAELKSILTHVYADSILYNKDLQQLYFKLVNNIEVFLELVSYELPEEVLELHKESKIIVPKRSFKVEKGELVETEVGQLDKAREEFLQGEYFKQMQTALQQK